MAEKLSDFLPEERAAVKRLLQLNKNSRITPHEYDFFTNEKTPITGLRIYSDAAWTEDDFEALKDLRHVKKIEIGNMKLTKRAVQILADMPELKELTLEQECSLRMDLIEPFSSHPKLSHLYLNSSVSDERCFEFAATLPSLEQISIRSQISNATCHAFAKNAKLLSKLGIFTAGQTTINDEGFAALSTLPALSYLHFSSSLIRGKGAAAFHSHTKIYILTIRDSKIDDEGIAAFSGIKNLEHLTLDGNPITDAGIAKFSGTPKLKNLSLKKTNITGPGLDKLIQFKKLKELSLDECELIPKIVPILGKLTSIKKISVSAKYFSKDQKAALKLLLPKCKIDISGHDDEEPDEEDGPWNDPQYFWKNPPECLAGLKLTKKKNADDDESVVRFALSCSCGNGKGAVSGYPLSTCDQKKKRAAKPGELFVSPLKFSCGKCEKTTPILDTDEHGYNAQLGSSSNVRGVGKSEHCKCAKCCSDQWKLKVGIVHGDGAHEVWFDDPEVQLENYFDWFTLQGTCAKCKHEQTIADFECA